MATAQSNAEPEWITVGQTVVIIRDNIQQIEIPGEEGETDIAWQWDETRLSPVEYGELQKGHWKGPWTANTHKVFREYQHDRTIGLYDLAARKARSDASTWEPYILALDAWNAQISALAEGYSTDVPDLPAQPQ